MRWLHSALILHYGKTPTEKLGRNKARGLSRVLAGPSDNKMSRMNVIQDRAYRMPRVGVRLIYDLRESNRNHMPQHLSLQRLIAGGLFLKGRRSGFSLLGQWKGHKL